jgi:hypothetical protein
LRKSTIQLNVGAMTRPAQKEAERRTLDGLIAALALRLEQEPEDGEAPDFTIGISGRRVGVEITMYRSGATVNDGTERRPVESEWERLKATADEFRTQRAELHEVNIGLMFKDVVPPRRQHNAFLEEIAAFVRAHDAQLSAQDAEFWPPSFTTPLMQTYLRTLYLGRNSYAEWYSNLAGGFVGMPGPAIAAIVAEKSATQFRPADELWLVIQCGTRISEMMLDIMGVEDFNAVPDLEPYVFDRVFVLAYTGAYEWRRGAGWRKLTGESVADGGPSFDELKSVLSDPEWLADPDGKATNVSLETLRDMRKETGKP